jgi:hypothetical protein
MNGSVGFDSGMYMETNNFITIFPFFIFGDGGIKENR